MGKFHIEEIEKNQIRKLPKVTFSGKIVVVSTEDQEREAYEHLSGFGVIGFDTETKPSFKKGIANQNKVALLQLSSDEKAFIFRLNKRPLPKEIIHILASGHIVKAGAAVHDDIKALQQMHDFKAEGFADIQNMAEEAGLKVKSLRKLTAMLFHMRLSKSQRLTNWEANHLSKPQLIYAATDAWISLKIYNALKSAL
ncbi:MAG: 3'-5' exonuclease domain-containing protein 2 [Candidatus Delongbacteria bacterium]|nr:3'-5' exonuclease domain-containing protein 2 [Candidatus Delongbacteria bacterium]